MAENHTNLLLGGLLPERGWTSAHNNGITTPCLSPTPFRGVRRQREPASSITCKLPACVDMQAIHLQKLAGQWRVQRTGVHSTVRCAQVAHLDNFITKSGNAAARAAGHSAAALRTSSTMMRMQRSRPSSSDAESTPCGNTRSTKYTELSVVVSTMHSLTLATRTRQQRIERRVQLHRPAASTEHITLVAVAVAAAGHTHQEICIQRWTFGLPPQI